MTGIEWAIAVMWFFIILLIILVRLIFDQIKFEREVSKGQVDLIKKRLESLEKE